MPTADRSVLHVLPHSGGGGETYVDLLDDLPGYRFERLYLAPSPSPVARELAHGLAAVVRAVRGHDLLHIHGEVAAGLCVPLLATRPSVVTLHGLHLVRRVTGVRRSLARLNLRAVLRAADRTICVSESEHHELISAAGKASGRRAVVVRNGVHIPQTPSASERSAVRESLGISPSETVAIWVGSLDERKDPLVAVRAAEQASVTLLVVGEGPLRAHVERAESTHVRALGKRDDVSRLLTASDIFVLTSRREGLAFALLEAMARGLAPIVTRLPENLEAIDEAGVDVPPGDDAGLASALKRLATNADERAELGDRASKRIARLFSAQDMRRRTRLVYDEVLGAATDRPDP